MKNTKIVLEEKDLPKYYLNMSYYLKKYLGELPDPPLHPGTKKPIGPSDLAPLFPMELIKQEVSLAEKIEIPEKVKDIYRMYRPTPLVRAKRLEKALGTPAHIYFKNESVSPVGSHKLNTALAQAFYNKEEGVKSLMTETGAGQWGTALAMACKFFDLKCRVYMVKTSFQNKPYRRVIMESFGAEVFASPSIRTKAGRDILAKTPETTGSLGIAISEAIEDVVANPGSHYALGSVLNHVLLHQTVIGLEAKKQMEIAGEYPDIVIGCIGGGSNFAGIAFPFIADKLSGVKKNTKVVAVEAASSAVLLNGKYEYDFGDTAGMTPLLKMYTLGHDFIPSPIHAGGLRYHGRAPLVAFLYNRGLISAVAYPQLEVFKAAMLFTQTEGIIPAPESSHAIKAAIDEALVAKKEGKKKVILFNLSGHGLLDLGAYDEFNNGRIK
ncbi:TrpB-like pyridoxal phosphate-dependent enzyme [Candidatus Microgenomates bacterium]|nr:TrpB-like pyridoxal phosphate-dependent enzyme [Candidatus Microgenomates bacterium]